MITAFAGSMVNREGGSGNCIVFFSFSFFIFHFFFTNSFPSFVLHSFFFSCVRSHWCLVIPFVDSGRLRDVRGTFDVFHYYLCLIGFVYWSHLCGWMMVVLFLLCMLYGWKVCKVLLGVLC